VKDLGFEMVDEPFESVRPAGDQVACQFGFSLLVQTTILARGATGPAGTFANAAPMTSCYS
jgi:hypothetical protein